MAKLKTPEETLQQKQEDLVNNSMKMSMQATPANALSPENQPAAPAEQPAQANNPAPDITDIQAAVDKQTDADINQQSEALQQGAMQAAANDAAAGQQKAAAADARQKIENQWTGMTIQSFLDQQEAQRALDEQKAQAAAAEKQAYKTRLFGGITEAAASIANLIGTSAGASNQQWKSPAQEWAQRADHLRRERDMKLERAKAQLDTLKKQRQALAQAKAQAMQKYDKDKAAADLAAQQAAFKNTLELKKFDAGRDDANRKYNLEAAKTQANINLGIQKQAETERHNKEDEKNRRIANGIAQQNANTSKERLTLAQAKEERAAGKAAEKRRQTFIGTGSNGKNETLNLSDNEVVSTIANNFRLIDDWDEQTKNEVEAIVTSADFNSKNSEDIAKMLRSYAAKSPKLMQTLRDEANGYGSTLPQTETQQETTVKKSPMGPPEDEPDNGGFVNPLAADSTYTKSAKNPWEGQFKKK